MKSGFLDGEITNCDFLPMSVLAASVPKAQCQEAMLSVAFADQTIIGNGRKITLSILNGLVSANRKRMNNED